MKAVTTTVGAVSLSAIPGVSLGLKVTGKLTVQQVISEILKNIPGAPFPDTVDTLKSGSLTTFVNGIVTTTFATIEVINEAIRIGANLIIVHEPTFYNHADETEWLADDEVFKYKKSLIEKHNIVVWRFHDYIHAHKPDGVLMGVLNALEWEKYYEAENPIIDIPPQPLNEVIEHVKRKLQIPTLKYIGKPTEKIETVLFLPGAWGGKNQIATIAREKPDLTIVGEINEWETSEYIRDSRKIKAKGALVILGHAVSEEPGMKWMVQWLQEIIPAIKVTHVPADDPFSWM